MEKTATKINTAIVAFFKSKFPTIEIGEITWAENNVANEFRKLNVGDIVLFPISEYNYQTIRSTPGTSMVPERMEGRAWKTRLDYDNKAVAVIRTA